MRRALGLAIAAVCALASAAHADKADELFARGKRQLAKKQYAEACATFERVDQIDPGIGAKLNVALCYEEWGRLASAHRWYSEAERLAREARDKRAPKIKELIEALDPKVPRLTIVLPEGAEVEALTIDGAPLDPAELGRARRVDPGPHVIAYRVEGRPKSTTIAIERGASREVKLDVSRTRRLGDTAEDRGAVAAVDARPGRTRRIAAIAMMAAGGASFGLASYLALDARSDYRSALDAHCMGARDMCTDEGVRLTGDARSQANLGTVFAIAGVAVAAGGVALYLTTPKASAERPSRDAEALYLAPVVGDRAALVLLGGRY